MKFFDKFSRYSFVAIVVIIIGGITEIVALASPYWTIAYTELQGKLGHSGLWLTCAKKVVNVITVACAEYSEGVAGWLVAVRALNVIAMMFGSGALVFMGLFTFLNSEKWDRIFKNSAVSSAVFAGILLIIGAIVYGASVAQGKAPVPHQVVGAKYSHELSWAFALSIVAAILCIIAGIVMGFARKPRVVE